MDAQQSRTVHLKIVKMVNATLCVLHQEEGYAHEKKN